jgi:hypothetical protein
VRTFRLAALFVVVVALLTVFVMATAHAAPRVDTKPSAAYAMSNPCGSGSYCTETVTVTANPSNYNVRAWMNCTTGSTHYGGWHTSGTSTAGCGTGGSTGVTAGFQYDKTHMYSAQCWIVSAPRTGSC